MGLATRAVTCAGSLTRGESPCAIGHEVGNDQRRKEEKQAEDEEEQPAVPFPSRDASRPEGECQQDDDSKDSPEKPLCHEQPPVGALAPPRKDYRAEQAPPDLTPALT